jgi:hypothetical protein
MRIELFFFVLFRALGQDIYNESHTFIQTLRRTVLLWALPSLDPPIFDHTVVGVPVKDAEILKMDVLLELVQPVVDLDAIEQPREQICEDR